MKLPSLVVSLLFVVATAIVSAGIAFFSQGGPGSSEIWAAIAVAALAAFGRWLQEQQKVVDAPTVTTADGTVIRSRSVAKPVEVKNPVNEALFG